MYIAKYKDGEIVSVTYRLFSFNNVKQLQKEFHKTAKSYINDGDYDMVCLFNNDPKEYTDQQAMFTHHWTNNKVAI